jgi:uncharacterized membrane protein YdjX (TVP38/TMEM64 family)
MRSARLALPLHMPGDASAPTHATDAPERVRGAPTVVVEGRNCWRIARASRVAFLVDADAYFRALTQTLLRARRQVLILGWDIQAGARLQPRHMPDGLPPDLRGFLNALVARRRGLDVHLLGWDFSLVFALERELASSAADLKRPLEQLPILAGVLPRELREPAVRAALRVAAVLGSLAAVSAIWTWTDLAHWVAPPVLAGWAAPLRAMPAAWLMVAAGFVVASAVMVPVSALILACVLLFDPVPGALYALGGSVAAAAVAHTVGRTLWGDALRQLAGPHLARVARSLARHGVLSVAIVRLLPVAPFTIVNLVAGGIGVRASTFLLGTVLGMAPGVALFAVLAHMLWP